MTEEHSAERVAEILTHAAKVVTLARKFGRLQHAQGDRDCAKRRPHRFQQYTDLETGRRLADAIEAVESDALYRELTQ